jgi:dinuclear metal center YbgI/SA1388 family protein
MDIAKLYGELEKRIPRSLSCEWDNDGLLCCPDKNRAVRKVLVALDVTAAAVDLAIEGGYDCIVSHHPFIFKGLCALTDEAPISAKAIKLIREGISVMSFHTRLDALEGGVNDTLCALLGIKDTEPLYEEGIPIGRIGALESAESAEKFAERVKKALGAPFVLLADAGVEAHRVAVVGGSGKDMIALARAAGADTFLSGRFDYHYMTDALDEIRAPMNLLEAGHYYTEAPICEILARTVREIAPDAACDIFESNVIKAI